MRREARGERQEARGERRGARGDEAGGEGREARGEGREGLHLQETFSDVVKTDKTGLSKTAHTRWMISAFANFLPGSTIFRLA